MDTFFTNLIYFGNGFFIGAILFAPPLISSYIIIWWMRFLTKDDDILRRLHGTKYFIQYVFSIDANKGLFSQGAFWLSIITPIIYFLIIGGFAWKDYTVRLDAEGFKTFIAISALPLGILSLAIPISVSVSRFHASKQTAKQIEIVSQKNNIDLFNSHRKELFLYFSQMGKVRYSKALEGKNNIHPRIHKYFFVGKPENGTPTLNSKAFQSMESDIHSAFFFLNAVIKNTNKDVSFDIYITNVCPGIYQLSNLLGLVEIIEAYSDSSVETLPQQNGIKYKTVGNSTEDSVSALRYIFEFFKNLCDFAGYEYYDKKLYDNYGYLIAGNAFKSIRPEVIERIVHSLLQDADSYLPTNTKIVVP